MADKKVAHLFVEVYDTARRQWREFEVVPLDVKYQPRCGNGLHQLFRYGKSCACGEIRR